MKHTNTELYIRKKHGVALKPLDLDFQTPFDDASMISFIYEIPSGMPLHFND